jgi:hypothetical protein
MNMSSTPPKSFLGLSAELRLNIYNQIITSVPVGTCKKLTDYHGLILSCRQVYTEFEAEALKDVNDFMHSLIASAPCNFVFEDLEKLGDTRKVVIGLDMQSNRPFAGLGMSLTTLRRKLRYGSYALYMYDTDGSLREDVEIVI